MKTLLTALVFGTAFVVAAPSAFADQVSYDGTASFTNSGSLTFYSAKEDGTASGIFSPFANTTTTFSGFNFDTYTSGGAETIFSDTAGGETLTFVLSTGDYSDSYTEVGTSGIYNLTVTGDGTFYINGVAVASGTFDLTSQGKPGTTDSVSFSETSYETAAITPEPSGLMLLGTGLAGAAGMLMWRRRAV